MVSSPRCEAPSPACKVHLAQCDPSDLSLLHLLQSRAASAGRQHTQLWASPYLLASGCIWPACAGAPVLSGSSVALCACQMLLWRLKRVCVCVCVCLLQQMHGMLLQEAACNTKPGTAPAAAQGDQKGAAAPSAPAGRPRQVPGAGCPSAHWWAGRAWSGWRTSAAQRAPCQHILPSAWLHA